MSFWRMLVGNKRHFSKYLHLWKKESFLTTMRVDKWRSFWALYRSKQNTFPTSIFHDWVHACYPFYISFKWSSAGRHCNVNVYLYRRHISALDFHERIAFVPPSQTVLAGLFPVCFFILSPLALSSLGALNSWKQLKVLPTSTLKHEQSLEAVFVG